MSIARFAVTRRVAVAMMAAAFLILGIFALPRLAVALLPSFTPPVVTVSVNYPNVSPATIETTVTRPVENAVSRVAGIDILQSDSYEGQSVVRAQFHFGTDIDTAAVDVQQQVARIRNQLPNDPSLQEPQIAKADPNALPVVSMFATSKKRTLRDLSDVVDNQLSDEFSGVAGVASVGTSGEAHRSILIEPDSQRLIAYGVTASQIIARITAENVDLPAGIVQIGRSEYQIRTSALYQNAQEVAATVVGVKDGVPTLLSDVARVSDGITEQRMFARLNGQPSVRLSVTAQPDANIVSVANGVYAKIADIKRRYPDIDFGIAFDQREFIQQSVAALGHTAAYGAILAILIILLFLHSWRSTLIVGVSLPISVLGTLFAAYAFGQTLNTMTLGGLALAVGLIVDDAIVVIENIFRHLGEGERPPEAAEKATAQIFSAVLASSITVITVFVPLMLIPGLQGLIFKPFALMVMSAVAISLLVALTTVPMLSSRILQPRLQADNGHRRGLYARFSAGFDGGYERFAQRYRRLLGWALDRPGAVLGTAALILIATLVSLHFGIVKTETFPATNSRFVRFDVKTPAGSALNVTDQVSRLIEARLRSDARVVDVGAFVGSGGFGGAGRTVTNQASIAVMLQSGTSSNDAGDFVQEWQTRLGSGARRPSGSRPARAAQSPDGGAQARALRHALIGTVVRGRTIDIIQQQISQGQDALQIQIFGPDVQTLGRLAQSAITRLAPIEGLVRPDTNVTDSQPELDVRIDRLRAAQLGLSTGQVAQAISTATGGTISSYFQVNGTQFPITVESPASQRRTYASLDEFAVSLPPLSGVPAAGANGSVPISTTGGTGAPSGLLGSVPLTAVANINFGMGPSQISRQNKERRIDINAPIVGRTLGEVVGQSKVIMDQLPLPQGYHWQFGPAIQENSDTFSALGLIVFLAIALIYMLLAAQFESYLHPLIIIVAIPLAGAGIVLSLLVTNRAFGLTAFIGTLMLVGIVVKNAILVVEFTNQLRRAGRTARAAVLQAAPMRLRPILMTTLATIGGMLPISLGIEPGSSTQAHLGTVVIGGLITSTLLSLVVIPTLYLWASRRIERRDPDELKTQVPDAEVQPVRAVVEEYVG